MQNLRLILRVDLSSFYLNGVLIFFLGKDQSACATMLGNLQVISHKAKQCKHVST